MNEIFYSLDNIERNLYIIFQTMDMVTRNKIVELKGSENYNLSCNFMIDYITFLFISLSKMCTLYSGRVDMMYHPDGDNLLATRECQTDSAQGLWQRLGFTIGVTTDNTTTSALTQILRCGKYFNPARLVYLRVPVPSKAKSMLRPLSPTNHRLNSCLHHPQRRAKASKEGKRVTFSKEGFSPSMLVSETDVAMAQAKQQAKRKGNWKGSKTPPRQVVEEIPVIGSSCTWRDAELDHFRVKVHRDVDVRKLILDKFWRFDHLEYYEECSLSSFLSDELIVGKERVMRVVGGGFNERGDRQSYPELVAGGLSIFAGDFLIAAGGPQVESIP